MNVSDRPSHVGGPSSVPGGDPSPSVSPGGRNRILIADDDPDMRELFLGLVQELGYDALAVPDGQAALGAVGALAPDLALSDVGMPGLSGFEVCRRVKNDPATRLIPVVLITGIGEEHKVEGMKAFTDELESAGAVLSEGA